MKNNSPIVTPAEAAKMMRISQRSVLRWCKSGLLRHCVLPNGQFRLSRVYLEKIIEPLNLPDLETE